jgi:hypothetical protein
MISPHGFSARFCQPSTLRVAIRLELRKTKNNLAAVSLRTSRAAGAGPAERFDAWQLLALQPFATLSYFAKILASETSTPKITTGFLDHRYSFHAWRAPCRMWTICASLPATIQ